MVVFLSMAATAILQNFQCSEITKMRGNFWKTIGHSLKSKCMLYPEETLYLLEKKSIELFEQDQTTAVELPAFYDSTIQLIGISCYLAYVKLKVKFHKLNFEK